MTGELLLDTGPLVALLDRSEQLHEVCLEALAGFRGRLLSTEAVVTEAMCLLRSVPNGPRNCLRVFTRGHAAIVPVSVPTLERVEALMAKYADVPMDYADATLVALAEDVGIYDMLTLDRRGFSAYRPHGRGTFRILP
jgi:predicted nucleic acid-binding protein